jgi:UDP-3-O-[3-hydroxymyristoyl] glucosamine N-acyltransferase LpxD
MSRLKSQKPMTAADLVAALPGPAQISGDPRRVIHRVAPLEDIRAGALIFSKAPIIQIPSHWSETGDIVVVAPPEERRPADADLTGITLIEVAQPRAYFIRALHLLTGGEFLPARERSTTANVADDAKIGTDVHIGANVTVGSRAVIGDGCVIYGGAQIYDDVAIGAGCIVHANAVVGCHGQAYVRDEVGRMIAMPHFGRVLIGERCRVGASASIVRGTLRDTVIGPDTSIGNMANIGHNVEIGARCFIGPGALLAGSSSVGDDTWVSIGAIVRGVAIGKNVMVGAGAVVTRPVADSQTVNGFPARVTAAHS